jgi:hypothetical protein
LRNKAAPGIRSWDSQKCAVCKRSVEDDKIVITRRSRKKENKSLIFHGLCYEKVDNREFYPDEYICASCEEGVTAGSSFVIAEEKIKYAQRTLYIMHEECFEEVAGKDFWDEEIEI